MVKKGFHINPKFKQSAIRLSLFIIVIIIVNVFSSSIYKRFDLTQEKRYSISQPTKTLLGELEDIIYIKVYLAGDLPADIKRLQNSTKDLLNEFRAYSNKNIQYEIIDPFESEDKDEQKLVYDELISKGLQPMNLQDQQSVEYSEKIIFPGAIVNYGGREWPVPLLENQVGYSREEVINHSIILLEYKFTSAIDKLSLLRQPKVAFLSGHGELQDAEVGSIAQTLQINNFAVERLNLVEKYKIPDDVDVAIVAKPTVPYNDKDKYKLDQFVMRGGKIIWLVDGVSADMDSLFGKEMFFANGFEHNLDDILFKYGVRINQDLVQDMQMCNPIMLQTGTVSGSPQYNPFPWYYYPLLNSSKKHSIVKNLDPVAAYFANTIDTIRVAGIEKTVLLQTSTYSRAILAPARVHLGILREEPNPEYFKQPNLPVAVLLEGSFESIFKNRIAESFIEASDTMDDLRYIERIDKNKMIVIADGDIIKNEVRQDGYLYDLGFVKETDKTMANKDFILNCIEYLVDDNGLIETRTKEVKVRLLDKVKIKNQRIMWQLLNIGLPILLLFLFGLGYNFIRRMRFT